MTEGAPAMVWDHAASHLSLLDYVVFSMMLVASIGVGLYSTLKSRGTIVTTQEFLLGNRHMPIHPVALSLLGGIITTITILGNATEMYLYGTQLTTILLGITLGILVVRYLTMPILNQLHLVSVLQYIHLRFNSAVLGKMASVFQLQYMFTYMGLCIYGPSLAVSTFTTLPIWAANVSMSLICIIYITIGGVKAVVYTDVIQTLLMMGGLVFVVVQCCIQVGGLQPVWDISYQGGRIEFFNMDPSPFIRHTFWSTLALGIHYIVSYVGLSQPQFQRFSCVKNIQQCTLLLKIFAVGLILIWSIVFFSGLVAYAIYKDCDPLTSGRIEKGDQIIPYMVMDKLGHLPGAAGLFMAAVYGGVLSTMSTQANSFACLVWEDFLKDHTYFKHFSDTAATNTVRVLSALAVLLGLCLAFLMEHLGQLFLVGYSICSAVKAPLDGLFLTGICLPWTNKKGAMVGLMVSFITCMWLVTDKFVHGGGSVSHLPLSTEGCPENIEHFNTTLIYFSNLTSLTNISFPTTFSSGVELRDEEPSSKAIRDISYCYLGLIGIIITMGVSGVVSLCTGPITPKNVNERMVNSTSARLYRHVWRLLSKSKFLSSDWEDEEATPDVPPTININFP